MPINEVFPNPTVKQVIFEIRFPNLFYIENKIGDFQQRILQRYPESSLLFRRQLLFADLGPSAKIEDIQKETEDEGIAIKLWEFSTLDKKVTLVVKSDSLSLNSNHHKTYNLGEGDRFREIIEFTVSNFLEEVPLPIINRIGLRYIDECPLPNKDNATLTSYYNSAFPISKFNFADTSEFRFRIKVMKDGHTLTYMENLIKREGEYKLILDFDAYAEHIQSNEYLSILDRLHEIVSNEFQTTIKEPVYEYMRTSSEVEHDLSH